MKPNEAPIDLQPGADLNCVWLHGKAERNDKKT
jgi:hypothetical protein